MKVIPSLDVETPQELQKQLERLTPFYQRFQIDIADGHFVPFTSLELNEALIILKTHRQCVYDFHLMIEEYKRALEEIRKFSLSQQVEIVFIHSKLNPAASLLEPGQYPFMVGLAINPDEDITTIQSQYNLEKIQSIQIMSVNPGPQGSPFIKETIQKIEQLRLNNYRNDIFLDGGINNESLEFLLHQTYRPDYICPGSFFSHAENIKERVQYLSEVLSHAHNGSSHA